MNVKQSNVREINPTLKHPEAKSLTDYQLDEIIFPDLSQDKFTLNGQDFRIRVLNYRWEKIFRRQAMNIQAEELKPFERLLLVLAGAEDATKMKDLGLAQSIALSEVEVDAHLTNCVVVMCLSQDPAHIATENDGIEMSLKEQTALEIKYRLMVENLREVPGGGGPRQYLRAIVRKQSDKLKLVQDLGESLMARFEEAGTLLGAKEQFDSLKQGFIHSVRKFTEKAGKIVKTSDSLSSPSTESGSEKLPTPKKSESPAETAASDTGTEEATQAEDAANTAPMEATSGQESESQTQPA